MSPVQEGSVVVYVIDNSPSLGLHRKALFDAFDGLTGGASSPNVRLAAVKHGYSWWKVFHSVEKIKNSLFNFRAPDAIPVNTLRGELSLSRYYEQLYPGIMAAWKMIEDECPPGDDLTAKPWCQRKVIVALGDGDPGISLTNTDYFPQPYADAFLPTNLLSGLKNAGIRVDTLCVGKRCKLRMRRCEDPKPGLTMFAPFCPSPPAGPLGSEIPAGLLGSELMEAISSQTGGVYHGVAD